MNKYKETLNTWAYQFVPADATITRVDIVYSEGHSYSEYTIEDDSITVMILYNSQDMNNQQCMQMFSGSDVVKVTSSLSVLLQALFAIEDENEI